MQTDETENKFIDFFIRDTTILSFEEKYKVRTILWMSLITIAFSLVMIICQVFGYFEGENALELLAFCLTVFVLMKFQRNLDFAFYFFLLGGAVILIMNIIDTGLIYSYNQKWFIVFLLFVSFALPKITYHFLLFTIAFQFYAYFKSETNLNFTASKEEYLLENIAFLIIGSVSITIFRRIHLKQNSRIDEQKNKLLSQQTVLIKNNNLLKQKSSALRESNQELERFAHIASHDLKTPLINMISFSNLLEKELEGYPNEQAHRYLKFIKDGSNKLNTLIKDVLEYSKVSSQDANVEDVDLNQLIDFIQDSISEYIKSRNGKIIVKETLPIIKVYKTKMYFLFKSLIENGLKYNESEIPLIEISHKINSNQVVIEVKDNGIGIPNKYKDRIFEMFSRLHNNSQYEGSGIGLAMCKKIVDGLSGNISLESQIGKGTSYYIALDKKLFSL